MAERDAAMFRIWDFDIRISVQTRYIIAFGRAAIRLPGD
jgi:hypothetical protein